MDTYTVNHETALKLDNSDPLKSYRKLFYIPKDTIYLDGNSLGLLSKPAEESLLKTISEWKNLGINGWFYGNPDWWHYGEYFGELMAPLVGAKAREVIATGTTTLNLHTLVSAFFQPSGERNKILADELNFPTDIYALESQIKLKGLSPDKHLVFVPSLDGRMLDEQQIIDYMNSDIALVLLPSVLYRSGQLLDIEKLTQAAHARGIPIGFDCSHSVGVVPHKLHEWEVDFAIWCSYKYLNSGPGGTAFLFIHEKHFDLEPGLSGWFGYVKSKQFDMLLNFEHEKHAGGWQISSSNILCSASLEGSLKMFHEVGIEKIREKSIKLTDYLIYLADEILVKKGFTIGTPRVPQHRSGHVALEHEKADKINQELMKRNVITDFRKPNIIRIAPIALYNTYNEVWQTIKIIEAIIDE